MTTESRRKTDGFYWDQVADRGEKDSYTHEEIDELTSFETPSRLNVEQEAKEEELEHVADLAFDKMLEKTAEDLVYPVSGYTTLILGSIGVVNVVIGNFLLAVPAISIALFYLGITYSLKELYGLKWSKIL